MNDEIRVNRHAPEPVEPDVDGGVEQVSIVPTHRRHFLVAVIGGGNAGLSVAGRLNRMGIRDIAVIEPREDHVYKPLLSHIAGGMALPSTAVRNQGDVTPRGVKWIQETVKSIQAPLKTISLASGETRSYDQVVICPGIHQDWDKIPGLARAMQSPFGASNYTLELATKASSALRNIRSGSVIFSQPPGPASCAAAAQKPMYLACDYWRSTGVLDEISVTLLVPDETIFGMPTIDQELSRKIAEYGIQLRTRTEIIQVDTDSQVVEVVDLRSNTSEILPYDFLHVEPPQSAPGWIADSSLYSERERLRRSRPSNSASPPLPERLGA